MSSTRPASVDVFPAVLDSFPAGLVLCDPEWRIRWTNRGFHELAGINGEEVTGKHICLLPSALRDSADPADRMQSQLVRLTCQTEATPRLIYEWQKPELRYIEQKTARVADAAGKLLGYLCVLSDVTKAKEIDEMKNDFISVASHELRTPMTSIKGSLDLLLGGYAGPIPDPVRELLEIGQAAVDRLIRLINDILDISKIEAGKIELNLEFQDSNELIRRAASSLRSYAEGSSVSLVIQPGPAASPVMADRDRLDQVLMNLLSNAIKYAPAGTPVEISVRDIDSKVRFSVRDRGPGIPADKIHRVFDKFQQLEGAKKGTGLGLAICQALIREHGGDIWVRSQFGEGACFEFELPAAKAAS